MQQNRNIFPTMKTRSNKKAAPPESGTTEAPVHTAPRAKSNAMTKRQRGQVRNQKAKCAAVKRCEAFHSKRNWKVSELSFCEWIDEESARGKLMVHGDLCSGSECSPDTGCTRALKYSTLSQYVQLVAASSFGKDNKEAIHSAEVQTHIDGIRERQLEDGHAIGGGTVIFYPDLRKTAATAQAQLDEALRAHQHARAYDLAVLLWVLPVMFYCGFRAGAVLSQLANRCFINTAGKTAVIYYNTPNNKQSFRTTLASDTARYGAAEAREGSPLDPVSTAKQLWHVIDMVATSTKPEDLGIRMAPEMQSTESGLSALRAHTYHGKVCGKRHPTTKGKDCTDDCHITKWPEHQVHRVQKTFDEMQKAAGVERATLHKVRVGKAIEMAADDVDLVDRNTFFGWSKNSKMSQRYARSVAVQALNPSKARSVQQAQDDLRAALSAVPLRAHMQHS